MTEYSGVLLSEQDLQLEILSLRRALLSRLTLVIPLVSWGVFYYAASQGGVSIFGVILVSIVCLAAYMARRLALEHYRLAGWILMLTVTVAASVSMEGRFTSMTIAASLLNIIMTHALLGGTASIIIAVVSLLPVVLGWKATQSGVGDLIPLLALYLAALAVAWLVNKPLVDAADLALTGWAHARNAMLKMREQRSELRRAVRSLDEANYRIERSNHELIVAQQAAETARELKARFAATVSHELRGPLNLILGFSRLMCLSPEDYDEPLPASYRSDIYTIYRSCQHLLALVDDILDLSQMEAQQLPLVKDKIDPEADVIEKALGMVRPLAERKGLALDYRSSQSLPWVLADAVRLRQALLNVLLNAVRFTDRGGITIEAQTTDTELIITVADTGRGIAEEDLPKLFTEFTQVHASDVSEATGSGLGLAISKQLVALHGGKMWATSRAGVGTTLGLSLPLPGADSESPNVISTGAELANRHDAVCMVVHDDADIVRLLARYLGDCTVVGIPNPGKLEAVAGQLRPVTVITSDLWFSVVHDRAASIGLDTPIISCELPRMNSRDRMANVVGYLVKPIKREVLTATLAELPIEGEVDILIADDDADTVRLLERMLTALPYRYHVRKAYDGAQALDMMLTRRPDLFLVDLVMPTLEGQRVLEIMQTDARLEEICTVVITGRDWIDETLTLGSSIKISFRQSISLASGMSCLKTLVNSLQDWFTPVPRGVSPSPADPSESPAFGAQPERPAQEQDQAAQELSKPRSGL
jgi:signal transduction histidine kinase/CheY-like chemotaxis protein